MKDNKKYSINEVIANPDLLTKDNCFGFYDWFCQDKSLKNKSKSLLTKVKFLVKQGLIDGDTHYVWFKNNCPCVGSLYDDFRISRIEDDEYICGCMPSSGHDIEKGICNFWTLLPEFDDSLKFDSWKSFKNKIKSDGDLRIKLKELIETK